MRKIFEAREREEKYLLRHCHCKIQYHPFTNGICKGKKYQVQTIEKMGGNGRAKKKQWDPSFSQNGLRHYRQLIHME